MSHKKSDVAPTTASSITREEAQRQAKRIVDKILEKRNPIGRRAILEGLIHPELSARMSKEAGLGPMRSDPSFRTKLKSALEKSDRKKLIELFTEDLLKHPMTPGTENEVVQAFGPQTVRKVLLEIADTLKGKPGRAPLVEPADYPKLAIRADSIQPVVLKIIVERHGGNTSTIRKYLDFWKEQFPEPCLFLIRHADKLTELLNAEQLPKPAKKLETQARVIADSLAGCEEGLTFATSIERVREGRHLLRQSPTQNSAN
jgi:hypothetical protein